MLTAFYSYVVIFLVGHEVMPDVCFYLICLVQGLVKMSVCFALSAAL